MATLQDAFNAYTKSVIKNTSSNEMDGRSWLKFCKDLGLLVKPLGNNDCDIVFSQTITKSAQKKISFKEFQLALERLCIRADGKLGTLPDLHAKILENFEASGGKKSSSGTVAESNKFHDDKSLYTGVYKNGGPTNVDLGTSDLKFITNRAPANVRGVNVGVPQK